MAHESTQSLELWIRTLPSSRMARPQKAYHWLKYLLWRAYTPYHPFVRDLALSLGIVRHEGRQGFLLGKVAPGQTIQDFILHCINRGYGNHFIAWHDEGELVSLRYVENFAFQYHLRVFEDGEVRGHYEYTPECYPLRHMKEKWFENRKHVFFEHLGEKIMPTQSE